MIRDPPKAWKAGTPKLSRPTFPRCHSVSEPGGDQALTSGSSRPGRAQAQAVNARGKGVWVREHRGAGGVVHRGRRSAPGKLSMFLPGGETGGRGNSLHEASGRKEQEVGG